jgi:lipopolysaccharide transport system ATP-binding protein
MAAEVLVKVEGLSKKFCKDLKTSLWYGVKDLVSGITGSQANRPLRDKEFWAVKDISFELRRGECLGLIGHNGAGKSTLLKILNGLINPDEGSVTMRGRVGALIELGAGFNPILTGRENIYNNGAVLGFTRKEIDAKVEEIIDFAEIREFIDMPVQNYSSGMKVRLGFAVAVQMEPDVLIIDEVLAVGDLGFVLKCFRTLDVILHNTAVIFVSHNMPMISRICDKIILLNKGRNEYNGPDVGKAIDLYYKKFADNISNILFDNGTLELKEIQLIDSVTNDEISSLNWGQDLCIAFSFVLKKEIDVPLFKIVIFDKEQRPVAVFSENKLDSPIKIEGNQIYFKITHKGVQLSKGIYTISIAVFKFNTIDPIFRINQALNFQILHQDDHYQSFLLDCEFKNL